MSSIAAKWAQLQNMDRTAVLEMLQKYIEDKPPGRRAELDPARVEHVQALIARVTDANAPLVWDACLFGQMVGMDRVRSDWARELKRGRASVLGQWLATDPSKAERRKRADTLYGEYLAKYPNAGRMTLCGMVGKKFDVTAATVAQWVPNPTPTGRGRPKKNK